MCVIVSLTMSLEGSKNEVRKDCNDIIDIALELGLTCPHRGSLSAAGCVRLAMEFGKPKFGALGKNSTDEEGQSIFREHLSNGIPIIVMTTVNCQPGGGGHSQCIVGIDENNNLTMHDPYSSIKSRGEPSKEHSLGKPNWKVGAGAFKITWKEFDKGWNTIDNIISIPDSQWDPTGSISNLFLEQQWIRFWCAIYPKD